MDRIKPQNDIYYENLPTINRNVLVAEPTEVFWNFFAFISVRLS